MMGIAHANDERKEEWKELLGRTESEGGLDQGAHSKSQIDYSKSLLSTFVFLPLSQGGSKVER